MTQERSCKCSSSSLCPVLVCETPSESTSTASTSSREQARRKSRRDGCLDPGEGGTALLAFGVGEGVSDTTNRVSGTTPAWGTGLRNYELGNREEKGR